MPNTMKNLCKKSILAIKDGVFFEKLKKYILYKMEATVPSVIKVYNVDNKGDWYHGTVAENYESRRLEQHWWHEETKILEKFLTLIPQGANVLDVPVGTARFLPLYIQNRMSMTGLDISSDMLDQAKKLRGDSLNGCQLDIGDATNLSYADNSFDLVVCFRFLDGQVSYEDAIKAIVEYFRVSRKYLILELGAVPQKEDDSVLTLENLNKDLPISSKLSEKERQKMLESNGLKILQSESACHEDGTPHMNIYLCEKLIENSQ